MRKKVIVRKVNRETGNKTLQAMNRKKMIENFEKNLGLRKTLRIKRERKIRVKTCFYVRNTLFALMYVFFLLKSFYGLDF